MSDSLAETAAVDRHLERLHLLASGERDRLDPDDVAALRAVYTLLLETERYLAEVIDRTREEYDTEELLDAVACLPQQWLTPRITAILALKDAEEEETYGA